MTLTLMSILEIPVMLLINGASWWSLARAIKLVKRFRPRAGAQVEAVRKRTNIRLPSTPVWACALGGICLAIIGTVMMSRRPVLVQLFGEWGCACGDYHEKVTGVVVRNPLRDRQPERVAGEFLDALKANRCVANSGLCDYALPSHRISDWRLVNREDAPDSVRLYFKLAKYGTSNPGYHLTGEGMVQVERSKGGWQVSAYSSYF
jgi:hypothetical protein